MQVVVPLPRTVQDQLVDHLRDDIVRAGFEPGEHLCLEDTAVRFDISTMPVRETLQDREDVYEIRPTLEAMPTGLAVPRMAEAVFEDLARVIECLDGQLGHIASLAKLGHHFHRTVCAAPGRRHLCDLNHTLRYRTQHYPHTDMDGLGSMALAQGEHRAILVAFRRGHADETAELMEEHVAEVGASHRRFPAQAG